jgi:lipopolysaccharide transport system ATP-binding protein
MATIRSLCTRVIVLHSGTVAFDGETKEGIDLYLGGNLQKQGGVIKGADLESTAEKVLFEKRESLRCHEVKLHNQEGEPITALYSTEQAYVTVTYECLETIDNLFVLVFFTDDQNFPLLATQNTDDEENENFHRKQKGIYTSTVRLPANFFSEHRYYLSVHLYHARVQNLNFERILPLDIQFQGYQNMQIAKSEWAWFRPKLKWTTKKV